MQTEWLNSVVNSSRSLRLCLLKLQRDLEDKIADLNVKVLWGEEGLIEAAVMEEADCVITAVVGMVGLNQLWQRSVPVRELDLPIRKRWFVPESS